MTTADEGLVALVAQEQVAMVRLATLLVGSRETAEDLVQDALATVAERWEAIDNPGGYLRTTVVNGCRMHLRRRDAGRRAESRRELPLPATAPTELVELRDALAGLDERPRTVLVLRYLIGADDAEIAELLRCARPTVRSLARRGLRDMRRILS